MQLSQRLLDLFGNSSFSDPLPEHSEIPERGVLRPLYINEQDVDWALSHYYARAHHSYKDVGECRAILVFVLDWMASYV
jgi:hypothetical protein